jgi:hypothetical protein
MIHRTFFAFSCALALVSADALAQDDDGAAEAKRQYQSGTVAFAAKRFNEAALAFEAAASYKANAVTLYTAAISWDQANAPERAADAYARALDAQGLTPQQQSTAKERLAALEKSLGTVSVTGPDGFKVQLDAFTAAPVPARLHGSPGMHTLVIRGTGGKAPEKRDVSLDLGPNSPIDVTPKVVVVPKPVKVEEPKIVTVEVEGPPRLSLKKAAGFSAIGVGAMSWVSAVILGLSAQEAGDAYNIAPTRSALDHANGLATWSTVAWVAGGVFVAGGVVLVILPEGGSKKDEPSEKSEKPAEKGDPELPPKEPALGLAPTLGGFMLRGSF